MEPLMDFSLEDQLISRAYRLGCKQSVEVYMCIMKYTLEEVTYRLTQRWKSSELDLMDYNYRSVMDYDTEGNMCNSATLYLTENIRGNEKKLEVNSMGSVDSSLDASTTSGEVLQSIPSTQSSASKQFQLNLSHYLMSQLAFIQVKEEVQTK